MGFSFYFRPQEYNGDIVQYTIEDNLTDKYVTYIYEVGGLPI